MFRWPSDILFLGRRYANPKTTTISTKAPQWFRYLLQLFLPSLHDCTFVVWSFTTYWHVPPKGMQLVMRYFVASELGICNLLRKHYCWTSNSLWFEEIPNATDSTKTLFLLGGKDDILNAEVAIFHSCNLGFQFWRIYSALSDTWRLMVFAKTSGMIQKADMVTR